MAQAVESWEQKGNVHLDLEQSKPSPRHAYLAELAARYGGNGDYLDVGCGPGLILQLIKAKRPDATFSIADAYPSCLDLAERHLGDVAGRYVLDKNDFVPEKVIDRKFDVIVLSHVLEHLRDPIAAINSLLSLLKPDGKLIIAVPNLARPEVVLTGLARKHYVNRGHIYGWDRSHFQNFLERICGLDVVEYGADVVYLLPGAPGHLIARLFGRALAKMLPWWSFSSVAVIRQRR
jgi:2-polyprenyl-3-methyl-5-hydroxy-6-metoxy-1,4-benzoquinol methylase